MSKLLLSVILSLMMASSALCQEVNVNDLMAYQKWRFNNKRVYLNEDEQIFRQSVFFDNLKVINEHSKNKEATYTVGLNQFSDMTNEEFKQKILNNSRQTEGSDEDRLLQSNSMMSNKVFPAAPQSVDWRTKGVLNPVQNQGSCGSCWTFSVIGGIEGFNAVINRRLEKYSEQQLVDCANDNPRSNGCNGGFQVDGIQYAIRNGVIRGSSYPYYGYKTSCRIRTPIQASQGFFPKKYQQVPSTTDGLKRAIAFAPVIATVNADNWQNYRGGIFNGCAPNIGMSKLNHAIVAVGYDAQNNWIIRNTWAASWGEGGYIRLAAGNTCGILVDNQVITE